MDDTKPKLNLKTLTADQRDKLESYNQTQAQLRTMQDIADISQEMLNVLDSQKSEDGKNDKQIGALLMDMRDSLTALNDKEGPETVDYAKPVVEAVTRLEKALASAIKAIDVKPTVTVDAPQVNVNPAVVDLKGIEKLLKTDMPEAFEAAIKLIPKPEKTDNTELLKAWEGISEQLLSIENATRLKPQPGTMKVTNPDGSLIGGSSGGLTDAQLRASAVPVSVASIPSHPVTNAGTFAVQVTSAPTTAVTGPLTDTQLRATPVPVTGTVTTTGLTDTQLRATAVPISLAIAPTTPVTGTFFQTTQPVSATDLPLPAGAATSANQQTNALTDAQLRATAVPVSGSVTTGGLTDTQLRATAVPISLATAPITPVTGTFFQTTQPVSAASLPLPAGAATAANQQTNGLTDTQLRATPVPISGTVTTTPTDVSTLNKEATQLLIKAKTDNIPALGQALAASSSPVVLTAAQLSTLTPLSSVSVSNFPATQPVSGTVSVSNMIPAVETGLAKDGTDITSPTPMPTGGAGIRGWLSAIWTKLNGTLAVTGTFFQATQPVSIAGTVTTTGGLTDTQLRATPVAVSGTVTTTGLTDTQLRATPVPVSGTVSTGGLTDTQLRATAVPVSGTVTMSNPTAQGLTDTQLRATAVPISLAVAPTTPVTGTFFQTTQPISGTVNTGLTQTTPLTDAQLRATAVPVSGSVSTGGLTDTQLRASAVPISVASLPSHAVTNAGTFAVQVTSAPTTPVTGTFFQATQPVSINSLVYPASTGNNTTTQLAAAAVFTGAIETILNLQAAQVQVVCDQPYTVTINQYIDAAGTQKTSTDTFTRTAGQALNENITLPGNYFNLTVTNTGASTTTTLRVDTTFGIMATSPRANTNSGNFKVAIQESPVIGTWGYNAGIAGTLTLTGTKRVLMITAIAEEAAASITINGGDTIVLPYGSTDKVSSSIEIKPSGNVTNPTIIFTGTKAYFVEYVS